MIRRIGAFAGLPLLSSIVPLALLPLISRIGGEGNWAALGLGQAIGGIFAIAIALGWPLTGPARVVRVEDPRERRRLYTISITTRGIIFVGSLLPMAIVCYLVVSPELFAVAFITAIGQSTVGISPAWYCIATGDARRIAIYEIFPRAFFMALSLPIVILTQQVIFYPIFLVLGGILGTFLFTKNFGISLDRQARSIRTLAMEIWGLRAGAGTTLVAGAYSGAPVIVLGIISPISAVSVVAIFVSADRLLRIALMAVSALGSSLQGWVAELEADRWARRKFSFVAHAGLGLVGAACFILLGPLATGILFGGDVAASFSTSFWFGLSFLLVSITTSTGSHMLVPLGQVKFVFWSTVAGAIVGVPAMVTFGLLWQGDGVAFGLFLGEFAVLSIQIWALFVNRDRIRSSE